MICQTCQTAVEDATALCPQCGERLARPAADAMASATMDEVMDGVTVVDGVVESASYALTRREEPPRSLLAALPRVTALAWRQPVVRAAVRTGASAVALSVATRLASRWLLGRRSPGARSLAELPLSALTDSLTDSLTRGSEPRGLRRSRRGRVIVSETFIYTRRVTIER